MRLTRLQLENFKACRKGDLALATLAVLIGANNAGKSSVLHSLALQAQSVPMGRVEPRGALVDLGQSLEALVHRPDRDAAPSGAEIRLAWDDAARSALVVFAMRIGPRGDVSSDIQLELDAE